MRAIKARTRQGASHHLGFFVAFEGGEGAGKTTQMKRLAQYLEERGEQVVRTREPGGTPIGKKIRKILLDTDSADMNERTEALLYAADRAQHVAQIIRPALEEGKVVVSDRFVDSSLAYQGLARGLGLEEIYRLSEWATGGLLPDLVLFMNLGHEEGLKRVDRERDRIESEEEEFHERVVAAYLTLARRWPDRIVVIDAAASEDAVYEEIVAAYERCTEDRIVPLAALDLGAPGTPVQR